MPNRRDSIRMSDEEAWGFIEEQKSLQFATINRDGTPHLVTLWFAIVDGRIAVETYTRSQKIRNLQRDPRLTLLLEDGEAYDELRGVSIRGSAELLSDDEAVQPIVAAVLRRNTPQLPDDAIEKLAQAHAHKRTAVLVQPEKLISWDHRKLGGSS